MVKLSVEISDHITPDFEGKLQAARELGIHNLEIGDRIDGTRIDAMTGNQLEHIRDLLIDYNIRIVLLSTMISLDKREELNRIFRGALQLDAEAIRIHPKEGMDTMFVQKLSSSYSIPLYIEN